MRLLVHPSRSDAASRIEVYGDCNTTAATGRSDACRYDASAHTGPDVKASIVYDEYRKKTKIQLNRMSWFCTCSDRATEQNYP